jgi:NAD(P)-dependent dehydrogenase (short-subunit alcohol dehydrogenase family)
VGLSLARQLLQGGAASVTVLDEEGAPDVLPELSALAPPRATVRVSRLDLTNLLQVHCFQSTLA